MSSKQEIKTAYEAELKTTPQYQIVLNIKNLILQKISEPSIQSTVVYNFETPQDEEGKNIIKECMIMEFGFETNNMNESCCVIEMKKFLE